METREPDGTRANGAQSPRHRRGAVALLVAVALIGSLLALPAPAGAMPGTIIDPEPDPDFEVPFRTPPNGFSWSVPPRFSHHRWNEAGGTARHGGPVETYDAAYVHPTEFPMEFDGCPSESEAALADGGETVNTYRWELPGRTHAARDCRFRHVFTAQGAYQATLTILDPDGETLGTHSQTVEVRDFLVVSLGDSYASGEGNPDVPQVPGFFWPGIDQERDWLDDRCHRSAKSGPARAAQQLESSDPHSSVTYLSFACSGATVDTDYFDGGSPFDPYEEGDLSQRKRIGSGVLGSYSGPEPPGGDVTNHVPSQIDQLRTAVQLKDAEGNVTATRHVDAITLSGGGNDVGFGPLATICVLYGPYCPDNLVGTPGNGPEIKLSQRFQNDLATMPAKYQRLSDALGAFSIGQVYLSEYPDPTTNENGDPCGEMLEDVIPPLSPLHLLNPLLPPWVKVLVLASNLVRFHIAGDEVRWAHDTVLPGLNGVVKAATEAHGWEYVGNIAAPFVGHGYCSKSSWIRRAEESTKLQGPYPAIVNDSTKGTLHPTAQGHAIYQRELYAAMRADLLPPPPVPPPSFSAANAVGTGASRLGDNGWLTGRCEEASCTNDPALLIIEATAGAATPPDTNGIAGTSVSVDGSPGCDVGVVTCTSEQVDARTHRWTFEVGEGVHQFDVVATDWRDQAVNFSHQAKVDLNDPAASAAFTPAEPGGGWYRAPVEVTLDGSDTTTGSGLLGVEYTLDGAAPQLVGAGTKVTVAGEGTHSLSYRALDWAGRSSAQHELEVRIDTTAPDVTCGDADGAWHAEDVAIACTASDGGSGLADDQGDAAFSLATDVADGVETDDAATATRSVCDVAGNCATAGPIGGNRVDKRAPEVTATTPTAGGSYTLHADVDADYHCTDGGAGVASCTAPVADGAHIDTSSVGPKPFAITATDHVGNTTTVAADYEVHYDFKGFFAPVERFPEVHVATSGATIPVKFSLSGDQGLGVLGVGSPRSAPVACGTTVPLDAAAGEPTAGTLGYEPVDDQYVYLWRTEWAWRASCRQFLLALDDGTVHRVVVRFR